MPKSIQMYHAPSDAENLAAHRHLDMKGVDFSNY